MIRPLVAFFLIAAGSLPGAVRRVVIVKADGVPGALLEQVREERNPATGRSRLPWVDRVFGRQGVRIANFYVRGISLSTPSWAMLDTGLDQRIHGNVEYDRLTLRPYDYLNFVPFFLDYAFSRRVDMPGVEVLDEAGAPLLIDRFPPERRFQSFQLLQRGNRWRTLGRALPYHVRVRGPWRLLEDSQTGLEISGSVAEKTLHDLIGSLSDPNVQYLDFFTGEFDHVAHLSNDRAVQIRALERLDLVIGRLWTAIQASPLANETMLVLVSDHGMNTVPGTFSQGFSLVDWLGSAAGGGHHVVTNRYPLSEYTLHSLNPFVSEVTTASANSFYLKDQSGRYPTALLDLDGNERAAIQLRNNDLARLHMLLLPMGREDPKSERARVLAAQFFAVLDRRREQWTRTRDDLRAEMAALDGEIKRQQASLDSMPRLFSRQDRKEGLDQTPRRLAAHLRSWQQEERAYGDYIRSLTSLLALRRAGFDAKKVNVEDVIPKRSLGERNSIYDLQNYAIGPDPSRTIDYPEALLKIAVRNVVQKDVGPNPVDFVAMSIPPTAAGLPESERLREAVWLYGGAERQALILKREGGNGEAEIRYVPVRNLRGREDGSVQFAAAEWGAGFPLRLWEDPELRVPAAEKETWLNGWHTEREWLKAAYGTAYSDAVAGLLEQFQTPEARPAVWDRNVPAAEERMLLQIEDRRRRVVMPDMLAMANDHWNFNTRGFNPGGNHGSFFQRSAHATFLIAGGASTGIPQGRVVQEPYDSLSFVPTLLRLMGIEPRPGDPVLPGPVVRELFPEGEGGT